MEYYFYLWAGTRTSHTERWQALSSRYSLLVGCWPFGFPIMLTLKTGVWHRSCFYRDMAIPVRYGTERNKVVYFLRISKVPGVGPGEELHGTASDCDYWWQLTAQYTGQGLYLKAGPGRWHHPTSLWRTRHLPHIRWRNLRHGPGNRHLRTNNGANPVH